MYILVRYTLRCYCCCSLLHDDSLYSHLTSYLSPLARWLKTLKAVRNATSYSSNFNSTRHEYTAMNRFLHLFGINSFNRWSFLLLLLLSSLFNSIWTLYLSDLWENEINLRNATDSYHILFFSVWISRHNLCFVCVCNVMYVCVVFCGKKVSHHRSKSLTSSLSSIKTPESCSQHLLFSRLQM